VAGSCPDFTEGEVTFTVGSAQRTVRLWVNPTAAAGADGPLVFYWYATYGAPTQATTALGNAGITRIKAAGGVVAAPVHANSGTFPWLSGGTTDLELMDKVAACAKEKVGIDACHIHALGMSAGGLFTTRVSYERSSYVASVATYSGGGTGTPQDASNKFAAMIFHGGDSDNVFGVDFQAQSIAYRDNLAGHFTILCNHGMGHTIPTAAAPSVVQFFFDHPYKVTPSPYANGLPSGFPSYCTR
jgi:poly(3-hydroxybutyrate) depolymerase